MEYASKGVSGTALGLGIAGTALGILDGLEGALKTHGAFPVTVPAIPFISPAEKILSFSADDIATLKHYIEGGKAQ